MITFVLIAGLSRAGGPSTVGSIAIFQTIALTGLAAARAIGVDVWAASGAKPADRRPALSSSVLLAIGVLLVNTVPAVFQTAHGTPIILYWAATPVIVLLDAVRILLLHAGKTWVSVATQSLTLVGLAYVLFVGGNATVLLSVYLAGVVITTISGFFALGLRPPLPSFRYASINRRRSGPFLLEISLGSITQQLLFLLVTVLSNVETAGRIRIAQTLLGPMSVVYSGLSPQLLRQLGRLGENNKRAVSRAGQNFGLLLAACSFAGAGLLSLGLSVEVSGFSLLGLLTGHRDLSLPPIVAVCGAALASGGVVLGVGTAARVVGATQSLNRWRLLLIAPQIGIVAAGALTGSGLLAATGLAVSSAATALMSVLILSRNVPRRTRKYHRKLRTDPTQVRNTSSSPLSEGKYCEDSYRRSDVRSGDRT